MNLYTWTLIAHSYVRWVVLVVALLVLARTLAGWLGRRQWTAADERVHAILIGVVNVQFLLGLLLYVWLSPVSYAFFGDMGAGMSDPMLRFFGVEHLVGVLVGIALIHIGRGRAKKAANGPARHKVVFITLAIAVLVIAASIPWPSSPTHGRPLFRGTGLFSTVQPV